MYSSPSKFEHSKKSDYSQDFRQNVHRLLLYKWQRQNQTQALSGMIVWPNYIVIISQNLKICTTQDYDADDPTFISKPSFDVNIIHNDLSILRNFYDYMQRFSGGFSTFDQRLIQYPYYRTLGTRLGFSLVLFFADKIGFGWTSGGRKQLFSRRECGREYYLKWKEKVLIVNIYDCPICRYDYHYA